MENKRFCPNCGAEVTTNFCPYCGCKCGETVAQSENTVRQPISSSQSAYMSNHGAQSAGVAKLLRFLPPISATLFSILLLIFFALPQFSLFGLTQSLYGSVGDSSVGSLQYASIAALIFAIVGLLFSAFYLYKTVKGGETITQAVVSVILVYISQFAISIAEFTLLDGLDAGVAIILPLVFAILFAIASGVAVIFQKRSGTIGVAFDTQSGENNAQNSSFSVKKPSGEGAKKALDFVKKHKVALIVIAVLLVVVIVCATVIPPAVNKSNENKKFAAASTISLGSSKSEVTSVLGEADLIDRNNLYYWFDGEYKKQYEKLKALDEKSENASSFEELIELESQYEEIQRSLATLQHRRIEIFFAEDKVSFVKYDSICLESNRNPQKTVSEVVQNLAVLNESGLSINFDLTAKFTDGSFIRQNYTISKTTLFENLDENDKYPLTSNTDWGKIEILLDTDNIKTSSGSTLVPSYTVTFDTDGATVIAPKTNVSRNTRISKPVETPQKDGFLFCGWYTDKNWTKKWDFSTDVVNKSITLYARMVETPFKINLIDNGTAIEITGLSDNTWTEIEIPAAIGDIPVVAISDYVFTQCDGLTSVRIPNSITNMGYSVFDRDNDCLIYCEVTEKPIGWNNNWNNSSCPVIWNCENNVKDVDGNEYTIIDNIRYQLKDEIANVYKQSNNLSGNVTIPTSVDYKDKTYSVMSIKYGAFGGCSGLTSITLPYVGANKDGTTNTHFGYVFGASSSSNNSSSVPSSLKTVVITGGTSIGAEAFYGCSGLKSITIPNSLTNIGSSAFYGCSGLTSITIPDSVSYIGASAFEGCSGLTSITIPDSVTSIGSYAFYNCSGLTSITIPFVGASKDGTSNTLFGYIFGATTNDWYNDEHVPTSLKTVVITGGMSIGYSAFRGCSGLTSITIPDSVTSIGNDAFYGCSGLTSITIPDSVTSIGNYAFENCSGLTSITIPNSVTSIWGSFCGCSGLTSITIPNSVTSIGESTFSGCSGLTSITIPNSVTSIGRWAFSGCSGLTSITIPDSVGNIEWCAFSFCSGLTSITVAAGNEAYHSAGNCIIDTSGKTLIRGCGNSKIPTNGSVERIEEYAFSGCSGLTSITIPDSVSYIGGSAFEGCSGLTSITIPTWVTYVGSGVFSGCIGLTRISVGVGINCQYYSSGNCLIRIDSKTLIAGCKNSVIPTNVTSIGNDAFENCSGLTSITIPNSVTSIGSYAFGGCSGLTRINFGGTMEQWNAISKGSWKTGAGDFTVYCSDGQTVSYTNN